MNVISAARTLGDLTAWKITNMEMQKILYVAQILHLGRTGKPLFSEQFEAWDFGPVIPALYHHVKSSGRSCVRRFSGHPFAEGSTYYAAICEAKGITSGMSAAQMVQFAHRPGSAWERAYNPQRRHIRIANSALKAEYQRDFAPSQDAMTWAQQMADELEKSPTTYLDDKDEHAFRERLQQDAADPRGRTGRAVSGAPERSTLSRCPA